MTLCGRTQQHSICQTQPGLVRDCCRSPAMMVSTPNRRRVWRMQDSSRARAPKSSTRSLRCPDTTEARHGGPAPQAAADSPTHRPPHRQIWQSKLVEDMKRRSGDLLPRESRVLQLAHYTRRPGLQLWDEAFASSRTRTFSRPAGGSRTEGPVREAAATPPAGPRECRSQVD